MGAINVGDLTAGMVLASDLACPNGRLLLPRGAVIEPRHLRIMRIWGVVEADVAGCETNDDIVTCISDIEPEVFAHCEDWLSPFFGRFTLSHPAMGEIYRLCLLRAALTITSSGQPRALQDPLMAAVSARAAAPSPRTGLSPRQLVRDEARHLVFPEFFQQIHEALDDRPGTAAQVAQVVEQNPALTAQLLSLVNSPLYGFPTPIETFSRALSLIGAKELLTLILGLCVARAFQAVPAPSSNPSRFWREAVSCGVMARLLVASKNGLNTERFFVAGLLADVGRLPLSRRDPARVALARALARTRLSPLAEVEREVLGLDVSELGGLLLKQWGLPAYLVRMVAFRHRPQEAACPFDAAVIHVAGVLVAALDVLDQSGLAVPPLDPGAWDVLGLNPASLESILARHARQVSDIVPIFLEPTP